MRYKHISLDPLPNKPWLYSLEARKARNALNKYRHFSYNVFFKIKSHHSSFIFLLSANTFNLGWVTISYLVSTLSQ